MYVAITGSGKYRVIQFREDKRIPGTTQKKTQVIKTLGNYERMLPFHVREKFFVFRGKGFHKVSLPFTQFCIGYVIH